MLRISNSIESRCAREAAQGTPSQAEGAPCAGPPWPVSIILIAHICIQTQLCIPCPRADFVASAETCVKSHQRWNFTVSSGASETAIETRMTRARWRTAKIISSSPRHKYSRKQRKDTLYLCSTNCHAVVQTQLCILICLDPSSQAHNPEAACSGRRRRFCTGGPCGCSRRRNRPPSSCGG